MENPYSTSRSFRAAAHEVVRANHLGSCYIRPLVLRGYGDVGVNPIACPIEVYIAAWEWGAYLGPEALEEGVDVCVSSWTRMAPNTLPAMAKAGANYMNSQLIRMEAAANGYAEGIALDANGYVSEGSGENIFIVQDGIVYTPPLASSVLPGITRSSIMALCEDLHIPLREQMIPREMLYIADEVFFTGTAAEVTPLRSIDRIKIGAGRRGPITKQLQEEFFAIVGGANRPSQLAHSGRCTRRRVRGVAALGPRWPAARACTADRKNSPRNCSERSPSCWSARARSAPTNSSRQPTQPASALARSASPWRTESAFGAFVSADQPHLRRPSQPRCDHWLLGHAQIGPLRHADLLRRAIGRRLRRAPICCARWFRKKPGAR